MSAPQTRSMARLAATSLVGASIEWFDFYLYGVAAALVFPTLFFPKGMPAFVSVLASLSTYAVGFLARPFGALVFGHVGDRLGRKAALAVALVVMGLSTAAIGLLPSYAVIGAVAPALLVLLRCVQGLAIGGQWGGAMLLVVESAPPERRGFYGSFAQVGAPAGVVLANLAFLVIDHYTDHDSFIAWGWRIPFLLSAGLVGLAWYIHRRIEETAAFKAAEQRGDASTARSPILDALVNHPKRVLLAAGAFLAVQVSFYVAIQFVVVWGSNTDFGLGLPKSLLLTAVMCSSGIMAPSLLWCGRLSDRFGRRRVYLWGAALSGAWAFVMFPLIETKVPFLVFLGIAGSTLVNGLMYGPQAALFGELFPTSVRYSGASLGYQLGAAFGGGFAPIIATYILDQTHHTIGVSIYILSACLITIGCVLAIGTRREMTGGAL
jgi:MFS family permease